MEKWILFTCENGHIFSIPSNQITEDQIVICPICEFDITKEKEINVEIIK